MIKDDVPSKVSNVVCIAWARSVLICREKRKEKYTRERENRVGLSSPSSFCWMLQPALRRIERVHSTR